MSNRPQDRRRPRHELTYTRLHSRPPKGALSEDEERAHGEAEVRREREVSELFLSYLSSTGEFEDWEKNKDGDNPPLTWKAFLTTPSVFELADFAIRLPGINRLKLPRLEKMAKVGADIRASHKEAGFIAERAKRQNHDKAKVAELLVVPRYADLLEEDADASGSDSELAAPAPRSGLVKSSEGWRKEEREYDSASDSSDEELANSAYGRRRSKWLPRFLELLFDEQIRRIRRRQAYTEESRLMELLADEEADEEKIPDDGELEGSGDELGS